MYIMDVMSTCNSTALITVLPVVKNIMTVIQIVTPIVLIIASVVEFTRLSVNPEDKKGFRKILNKVIAAFIVFLIPVLVNFVMGIAGESTEFSKCWNSKSEVEQGQADYIDDIPENSIDANKK